MNDLIDNFTWVPLWPDIHDRIEAFADQWTGTPWVEGQRARRVGVDCVQLVGAFLDEMMGLPDHTTVPRLPARCAVHRPGTAEPTVAALRKAHHGSDPVRDRTVEPGDILVTRAEPGREAPAIGAHAMIALPRTLQALSASAGAGRVIRTSIPATSGVLVVFRPKRKDLWAGQR